MTNAEIQVGEYVRTKDGYISNVKEVTDDWIECESAITKHYEDTFDSLYPDEFDTITKHSFNIIDLIEVGDYVNGQKIYDIEKAENMVTKEKCVLINKLNLGATPWYEGQIKSIVTKEQFKSMEYKVGGEDD